MKKDRKRRRLSSHFSLMELVVALGLLGVLYGCFYTALNSLRELDRMNDIENRALLTLDNTVERVSAEKMPDTGLVKRIFLDEFEKSGLTKNSTVTPSCEIRGDGLEIKIARNNKKIAELVLKCEK